MKNVLEVAIGLLSYHGQILVGWRNAHQHQGGKSEFPGGKVEAGESPEDACVREIQEEVGIRLQTLKLYQCIEHEYDDLMVKLWFYEAPVTPQQLHQIQPPWQWVARTALHDLNFPSANRAVLARLNWSPYLKIATQLEDAIHAAQHQTFCYWRIDSAEHTRAIEQLIAMAKQSTASLAYVIVNQDVYTQLPADIQQHVFAIHLTQTQLMRMQQFNEPEKNYIAACHDQDAVERAQQLGCHAVLISPVLDTATHPHAKALGWQNFRALADQFDGLTYALGGQSPDGLATAQHYGAYGVAGIRAF